MIFFVVAVFIWIVLLRLPFTLLRILVFSGVVLAATFAAGSIHDDLSPVRGLFLGAATLWTGVFGYLALALWKKRANPNLNALFFISLLPVAIGAHEWAGHAMDHYNELSAAHRLKTATTPMKGMTITDAIKRCAVVERVSREVCQRTNLLSVIEEQDSIDKCLSTVKQAMQESLVIFDPQICAQNPKKGL